MSKPKNELEENVKFVINFFRENPDKYNFLNLPSTAINPQKLRESIIEAEERNLIYRGIRGYISK